MTDRAWSQRAARVSPRRRIGTFWLVLGDCGAAVLAAKFPEVRIGLLGVSLAFGLTVLPMAYALGHISGGHFNPAVTIRLTLGRRFSTRDVLPYTITQVLAAVAAAAVLFVIASGKPGFSTTNGFAANGFGPLAIGLALTLIHLVTIPVTNTSVNPARSTRQALFVGGWALSQLWLLWPRPDPGRRRRGPGLPADHRLPRCRTHRRNRLTHPRRRHHRRRTHHPRRPAGPTDAATPSSSARAVQPPPGTN